MVCAERTDEGVALKCIPVSEKDYGKDQEERYKTDLSIFETDEYFKNLYSEYKDKAPDDTKNYTSKLEEVYWNLAEDRTVMERPKVLYNDKTEKYVMWFHVDGRTPTNTADYGKARAGIAVSDNLAGPFKLLGTYLLHDSKDADHSWDNGGGHLRDMNLFKDDDGQGYVVYSSDGNLTTYIAKLNADYTGLTTDREEVVSKDPKATREQTAAAITSLKKAMDEVKKHPAKKTPNPVKVKKISISGSSKKIAAGKKIKLTAKISPSNASNKEVTWKSSNTKIAKVSKNGVVTLNKKSGGKSVTITAIAKDGSKVKATYKITCMKGKVTKVTITGKKTVKAGKSLKLTAKVKAQKSANKKLKWTSSNTRYAKVSSNGKVTTKKAGKGKSVKITAAATDGSGKKHTVKIKIK